MKISESEFNFIKEHVTSEIIQMLVNEQGYTLEDAVDKVYTSTIYEKLSNSRTGLFCQSPRYIMSYLI